MTKPQRLQRVLPRQVVTTRDRVELCTDVYLPPQSGAVLTVVIRTPYGRNLLLLMQMAQRFNAAGLAVVLQDCRGRYQSGGTYDWRREEDDTYDTLAWIAEQPWSDGRVGLYGMSISAHPNFLVAVSGPPQGIDIVAMVSVMGTLSHYDTLYRDGALVLHWGLPWFLMADETERGRTTLQQVSWDERFRQLPLAAVSSGSSAGEEIWRRVLSSPERGAMWRELDAIHRIEGLDVPTLFLSGWTDFMLDQTVEGFQTASSGAPVDHRLVLGPWDHMTLFSSFLPTSDASDRADVDLLGIIIDWFVSGLSGEPRQGATDTGPRGNVQIYLENGETWLDATEFPPAGVEMRSYYLSSGGRANTSHGDGELVPEPPTTAGRDTFAYDPEDPVPTRGGAIWPFPSAGLDAGPADQSEIEERADVLVYLGEPLDDDLCVVGPLEVELWVATSARDTDFTAKLVEIDLFGVPDIVQDGIVRGRFHRSVEQPEYLEPHKPYRMRIEIPAICRRFESGHRIGLEISSSSFPKFDRHLNTAAEWSEATAGMVAQQTVFHGGPMPSRLLLPVLPGERVDGLRTTAAAVEGGERAS